MEKKDEILVHIKTALEELFEVNPDDVELSTHLYEDLDLDSIDAVDLVIKLKELTGQMANADEFKAVRTVGDVVDVIDKLLST